MNKKSLIIYIIAFAAVIGVSVWAYNYMSESYTPDEIPESIQSQTVQPAPDFTVSDAERNPVKLSDFRGKPVIVNFWASWSGPCRMETPAFEKMYKKYGNDIEFFMVNMTDGQRETMEIAKEFVENSGYSFPVCFDINQEAAYTYYVNSIPMTLFIDAEGNLVNYMRGAINEDILEKNISLIIDR